MDKSDVQESLAGLYLRLNGYFLSGFIAHAPTGNLTEIDTLAVRFPGHKEPERGVEPCIHLHPPHDCMDVVVGEVKGGKKNPNFNSNFYQRPRAVEKVLNRIGAFSPTDIAELVPWVQEAASPRAWRDYKDFPVRRIANSNAQMRLILFAPDQTRLHEQTRPMIYGDDMMNFIWSCLSPVVAPDGCARDYNRKLWGHHFNDVVAYFKDPARQTPGAIEDFYDAVLGCR